MIVSGGPKDGCTYAFYGCEGHSRSRPNGLLYNINQLYGGRLLDRSIIPVFVAFSGVCSLHARAVVDASAAFIKTFSVRMVMSFGLCPVIPFTMC